MAIILGNLQVQFQQAYLWTGGKAGVIRNEISIEWKKLNKLSFTVRRLSN